jgi:hypothetical protein
VLRAYDRLVESSVRAVVGPTPPPPGSFARVDRVDGVWVARIDASPWATLGSGRGRLDAWRKPGQIFIDYQSSASENVIIRNIYDSGWHATLDGSPIAVGLHRGVFLAVRVPAGHHRLALRFDPPEVRAAVCASGLALCAVVFALTGPALIRSTRIITDGLGRTQAAGLESVLCSSPAKH